MLVNDAAVDHKTVDVDLHLDEGLKTVFDNFQGFFCFVSNRFAIIETDGDLIM